jgi:hypothetical protein
MKSFIDLTLTTGCTQTKKKHVYKESVVVSTAAVRNEIFHQRCKDGTFLLGYSSIKSYGLHCKPYWDMVMQRKRKESKKTPRE